MTGFQELCSRNRGQRPIHIFYYLPIGKWAVCPRQSCSTSEVLEKSLILQYYWGLVSRWLGISCKIFQYWMNRLFRIHDLACAVQGSQIGEFQLILFRTHQSLGEKWNLNVFVWSLLSSVYPRSHLWPPDGAASYIYTTCSAPRLLFP